LERWGVREAKWSCGVMVESTNSFRTEQLKKLGNLKHYYLDEFNHTGVFICHK